MTDRPDIGPESAERRSDVRITDEMVHAACAAQDGQHWREFNASLEWPVRAGLEAALTEPEQQDRYVFAWLFVGVLASVIGMVIDYVCARKARNKSAKN